MGEVRLSSGVSSTNGASILPQPKHFEAGYDTQRKAATALIYYFEGWRTMADRPNLRVIDTATGEVRDSCHSCALLSDQLAGAERDLRGWRTRFAELKRDKDAEARAHELWPQAEQDFDLWRRECRHPNSEWGEDRFWLWLPFGKSKRYAALIPQAIAGAAYDCFKVQQRNGATKRFDEWDRIFKDRSTFENFCNRAPRRAA